MRSIALHGRSTLFVFSLVACSAGACVSADAQIIYGQPVYVTTMRPVMAAPVVSAPVIAAPVFSAPAYVANYTPSGNYAAVTAFSPPVMAAPSEFSVRTAYAPVTVTSYYAPAAVAAAPVTAYYAPTMVATPLYRRGLFGAYRPVYYLPY